MRAWWSAAIAVISFALPGAAAQPGSALPGYSAAGAEVERGIESRFLDIPSAQAMLATVAEASARPHYAGTPADRDSAFAMRDRLRALGIPARVETLTAPVETPRELVLALAPPADLAAAPARGHKPFPVAFDLAEVPEPSDPPTAARAIGLPFDAGSGDGDVSAPLVYAGHGLDADYATLARASVDVRGAVLLVRYGAEFRGRLARRAQSRGAAGVIFYSDPQDDGAARGLVYPGGPWRPATSIERGWVGPGISIPILPISAQNAATLLAALAGPGGPPGWAGGLPVAYPLARGPGRVHLIVKLNRKLTTLWNTVGTIAGMHGERSVVLAAQRDAWVYGAGDDGAGVATVLEAAAGFSYLLQSGWHPERTIVLAGWDGGTIGNLGANAYAAAHRDALLGCVAYLDARLPVTGPAFAAFGAAALLPVAVGAARLVPNPLAPAAKVADVAVGAPAEPGGEPADGLAAGGIPALNLRWRGPFGVGGSSYDTLRYARLESDPDFSLHRAAAQLYGVVTLRLADAQTVPYRLSEYAPLIRTAVSRLGAQAAAAGMGFDQRPLRAAVDRLALRLAAADRRIAAGLGGGDAAELDVLRRLGTLVDASSGGTTLPELAAAVAAHDPDRIRAAAQSVEGALDEVRLAVTPAAATDQL